MMFNPNFRGISGISLLKTMELMSELQRMNMSIDFSINQMRFPGEKKKKPNFNT